MMIELAKKPSHATIPEKKDFVWPSLQVLFLYAYTVQL